MWMTLLYVGLAIVVLALGGFALLAVLATRHDPSDPRSRPNSYHSILSVEVDRPVDQAYRFMKHEIPRVYTDVSPMHEKFEILNAEGLTEGAQVDCVEGGPKEIVQNRYVVTRAIEDKLLQLESEPSVAYDRRTNRRIGQSNAYCYYDFEPVDDERTRLTQTIVIDMLNPIYKALGDIVGSLSGSRAMWDNHFREELDGYKSQIEEAQGARRQ